MLNLTFTRESQVIKFQYKYSFKAVQKHCESGEWSPRERANQDNHQSEVELSKVVARQVLSTLKREKRKLSIRSQAIWESRARKVAIQLTSQSTNQLANHTSSQPTNQPNNRWADLPNYPQQSKEAGEAVFSYNGKKSKAVKKWVNDSREKRASERHNPLRQRQAGRPSKAPKPNKSKQSKQASYQVSKASAVKSSKACQATGKPSECIAKLLTESNQPTKSNQAYHRKAEQSKSEHVGLAKQIKQASNQSKEVTEQVFSYRGTRLVKRSTC